MQRALIRYFDPKNQSMVEEALIKARRTDLIGNGPDCLIKSSNRFNADQRQKNTQNSRYQSRTTRNGKEKRYQNNGKKKR